MLDALDGQQLDIAGLVIDIGENACLRPTMPDDVTQAYIDGLNDPEVRRFLTAARFNRQTQESVRGYVEANVRARNATLFGVYIDDVLRGTVRLFDIGLFEKQGHVGIALFDKSVWGKGWGEKAIGAVVAFAFETLRLNELVADIEVGNIGSEKAFAKNGFEYVRHKWVEGHDRELTEWLLTAEVFVKRH